LLDDLAVQVAPHWGHEAVAGRVQPASRQLLRQLRQSRAVGLVSTRLLSINGNRIDDRHRCQNQHCRLYRLCDRIRLK
jgi:hypothetical protein